MAVDWNHFNKSCFNIQRRPTHRFILCANGGRLEPSQQHYSTCICWICCSIQGSGKWHKCNSSCCNAPNRLREEKKVHWPQCKRAGIPHGTGWAAAGRGPSPAGCCSCLHNWKHQHATTVPLKFKLKSMQRYLGLSMTLGFRTHTNMPQLEYLNCPFKSMQHYLGLSLCQWH